MNVQNKHEGLVEILTFNGTLDSEEAYSFRLGLNQLITSGRTRLLLDISSVDFIDSSGLSALIGALKTTRRLGGNIGLLNPVPAVRSILEITRLHRILEIFSDSEEAVAKLSA